MDPVSSSPQPLTPDELTALQSCIDYYLEQLYRDVKKTRWPVNTCIEPMGDGYIVRHGGHVYKPEDWVHFHYLHFMRALGVDWAAARWEARNDIVVAALQAERRSHGDQEAQDHEQGPGDQPDP